MSRSFVKYICAAAAAAVMACAAPAQNVPVPATISTLTIPLSQPPQKVSSGAATVIGNPGPQTYYYWVVANYLVGSSSPAGPFVATGVPNTLSASNYVSVQWSPATSAVSYDVLRTATPAAPSGACNCAVATGLASSPALDQSDTLLSYTVGSTDANALAFTVTNNAKSGGVSNLVFSVNGATEFSVDSSGGIAAPSIGGVRYADLFPGADIGAKVIAAAAACSDDCTVVVPSGAYTLIGSSTWPAGVAVRVEAGALIAVPAGITLTIDSALEAGSYPIFSVQPQITTTGTIASGSADLTLGTPQSVVAGEKVMVAGASGSQAFGVTLPLYAMVQTTGTGTTVPLSSTAGSTVSAVKVIISQGGIAFGAGSVLAVNPVWFGADPTGSRGSSAAIQAAFIACGDAAIPCRFGPGTFLLHDVEAGDPMQDGNYAGGENFPAAASIIGAGDSVYGQAAATTFRDDGANGTPILWRHNMQGVTWEDFDLDGNFNASASICLDASFLIPSGQSGPATDDIFRDIRLESCRAPVGIELLQDNNAVIQGLSTDTMGLFTTTSTSAVTAGTTMAMSIAATPAALVMPNYTTMALVGSGATQELESVVVSNGAVTPNWNWQFSHTSGVTVVIPAIAVDLIEDAGAGDNPQDLYTDGTVRYVAQSGAFLGGWLDGTLELGAGGAISRPVALDGTQVGSLGIGYPSIFGMGGKQLITCNACSIESSPGLGGYFVNARLVFDSLWTPSGFVYLQNGIQDNGLVQFFHGAPGLTADGFQPNNTQEALGSWGSKPFGAGISSQPLGVDFDWNTEAEIAGSVTQVTAGVGCSAATNTVTLQVSWYSPGAGTLETATVATLNISGDGAVDSNANGVQAAAVNVGTAMSWSTSSTLSSTGCATAPAYAVDVKQIF